MTCQMVELLTPQKVIEEIPTQELDRAGATFLGACITGVLTIALGGNSAEAAVMADNAMAGAAAMADQAVNAAAQHADVWHSLSQHANTLYENLVM